MPTIDVAVLPAPSVAAIASRFSPSVNATEHTNAPPAPGVTLAPLQRADEIPDSASPIVPVTDTGDVCTLAPSCGDVTTIAGPVLSILIGSVAVAVLPARSVTV